MGSIKQEKTGLWSIRYDGPMVNGERTQKKEGGFRTKPMATAELKKREADVLRGSLPQGKDITLSQFIDIWIDRLRKKNRAPKTIRFYESIAENHIKPYFGKTKLSDIYGDTIESYYSYLSENTNLDMTSIHHNHKTLRACLNNAVKWKYLSFSPMNNAEAPPTKKTKVQYWEPDMIKSGLALFKGTVIEWHVNVALLTGLREGEICALNENCFDFINKKYKVKETAQKLTGQGIIFKEPKTECSMAELPMTKNLEVLFRSRILAIMNNKVKNADIYIKDYNGYLSVWADGRILAPDYVSQLFTKIIKENNKKVEAEEAAEAAGEKIEKKTQRIPVITFHGLRHSCASWLLYNGTDMKTLQEILRHANYAVTADTYSHIVMDKKREALEKISL